MGQANDVGGKKSVMNKSRHTEMRGTLARSFGVKDDLDLVVELREGGIIAVRQEPVDRRLKRGEVLPEVCLSVENVWASRKEEKPPKETQSSLEKSIDRLVSRIPIASFGEDLGDKETYRIKAWLWANAKQILGES